MNKNINCSFSPIDLTILIPTKDRPDKIKNLLDSILIQNKKCSRIIIISSGASIEELVMQYLHKLPVEYYECFPPGQIVQRNMGISLLDENTKLVACFDDDIELEPNAIEEMLAFWNQIKGDAAAIAFNVINSSPHKYSKLKELFGLSTRKAGSVVSSGYNTPISSASSSLRIDWVPGGATVWRKDILMQYKHLEIYSKWASCEDLIYSYPIGKIYPLYVCKDAKVRHEHVYDHEIKLKHKFYGKTETIWRYYFVSKNEDLSKASFYWMMICLIAARISLGLLFLRPRHIQFAMGQIEGLAKCLNVTIKNSDPKTLFVEKY